MKIILKQALVTPGNYPRIAARIVPQDQRDAIRPGIRISHYSFTNRQGQQVYIIVCHTTNRAGISFAEERTLWGRWEQETGIITTDDGRRFTCGGEEVEGGYSNDKRADSREAQG
jgi:hypothetical protein